MHSHAQHFITATATMARDPDVRLTRIHIPCRTFRTQSDPPLQYTIFFAAMQPVRNVGEAGDMFVELSPVPTLYIKTLGSRHPTKIAWRWVRTADQNIRHPLYPTLRASGSPLSRIPTWAPQENYNGDLYSATTAFLNIYGPGSRRNPINLTRNSTGTRSSPIVID